jgi:hypothetical protein
MANIKMNLITVKTTNGINEANIIKSKLESYGIPTLLKYESVGIVFGLELNGLGKVEVKVPKEFEEEALLLLNLNQ